MYLKTLKNIITATGAVAALLAMAPVAGPVGAVSVIGWAAAAAIGVTVGVADHLHDNK